MYACFFPIYGAFRAPSPSAWRGLTLLTTELARFPLRESSAIKRTGYGSWEVVVPVVEAGSFAAVAESAWTTAPMVGRHMRALEDELGTQLLNRMTQRHLLAEAGRIYDERSKSILGDLVAIDESVPHMASVHLNSSGVRVQGLQQQTGGRWSD